MPLYIMVTKLTTEGAKSIKNKPYRLKHVNAELDKMGVKVLQQYVILGEYDFLNVVEAADALTVAKASLDLSSRGTLTVRTYAAITADEFVQNLHGFPERSSDSSRLLPPQG